MPVSWTVREGVKVPLVANTDLPSFERLQSEGSLVIARDTAETREVRELHIGLLNMMPDKALEATERQFFRLVGESNQIARFYLHPFTLKELQRGREGREHVEKYYRSFEQIQTDRLDALIITGANVVDPALDRQEFWSPLIDVVNWAYDNVTSILCSCLATHALLQFRYGQKRIPLSHKCWGVYSHRVRERSHPLVAGMNTRFDVPHSRFNAVTPQQFAEAGLKVLVESDEVGVHLAASDDGLRLVFFQGHPEYDANSLLKEYKREVLRFMDGETDSYPPFPENYFTLQTRAILAEYRERVEAARNKGLELPPFPELLIGPSLDNTWHDSAESVINNWIGQVYRSTHPD